MRQACPGPVALVAGAAGSFVDFLPGEPIRVAAVAGAATQLAQVGPLTTREPTVLDLRSVDIGSPIHKMRRYTGPCGTDTGGAGRGRGQSAGRNPA